MERGAFVKSLDKHRLKETMPAMLWQHDHRQPIGVWTAMHEDDNGLVVEGKLALGTARGREVRELLRMGAVRGLSIGFSIPNGGEEWDEAKSVNRIKEVDLWETSIVTFPANEMAMVDEVRSAFIGELITSKRNMEQFLRDAGLPHSVAKKMVAGYEFADPQDEGAISAKAAELEARIRKLI